VQQFGQFLKKLTCRILELVQNEILRLVYTKAIFNILLYSLIFAPKFPESTKKKQRNYSLNK